MSDWDAAQGISRKIPRAFVTGAGGFLGRHVCKALSEWDLVTAGRGEGFPQIPVDVVFSLAATSDPFAAMRDPAGAYENNVRVMVNTLEYARDVGARVIHVSSAEAYPPRSPYGGAKACQDVICDTYQDIPVTVVVTQSLFGECQQPEKLIPSAIRAMLAGEPVKLQCADGHYARRPFMYAGDLARALLMLTQMEPGRYNVGGAVSYSLCDIVRDLETGLGVDTLRIQNVPVGGRVGHELDVKPLGCDIPGWEPTYPIAPALHKVARWYLDHPEWLERNGTHLADPGAAHSAPARQAA